MPHMPAFMPIHPSTSAGGPAMRDFFSHIDHKRPSPYMTPSVTPYLGLRARLSQVWINRWTILLLLVLARTLIAIADINSGLGSSRREALSACSSVESMGSAMASMPHYMSQGVNELTASGIEKSVSALRQTAFMAITAVEEIVIFAIHMLTSTYLCLFMFAVNGTATIVLDAMQEAQENLKTLTSKLGDEMGDTMKKFTDAYDKIKDTLENHTLGIGSIANLPDINLDDDIKQVKELQIPPGMGEDISKLKDSLPDFKQVQNFTDGLIRIPFEAVRQLVNESLGTYEFNRSVFPIPDKERLSFCSDEDGIDGFFNSLVQIASTAKKAFIAVLLIAALAACVPMAWREIRRWNTMKERSQLVDSGNHDSMDVVYLVSRPHTSSLGLKLSNATRSERRQNLIRWVVAYATTDAALFILCLAVAGLFSCLCQYILLKQLEKEVPALTSHVAGFADKVVNSLNAASEKWAVGANGVITDTNNTINDDMFGWVNTSTTALNDTLNQFVDLSTSAIDKTFGNTPLGDAVKDVLDCLIVFKVQGIQKGITWVHDNAHINLPLMPNNTFSLGAIASIKSDKPADQSFLANPGDEAADKISSAVARFLNKLYDGIRVEAIISTVVLMIWFIVLFIGIARAIMLWFRRDKARGNGGIAPVQTIDSPIQQSIRSGSGNQDHYGQFDNIPLNTVAHQHQHQQSYIDPGLPAYTKERSSNEDRENATSGAKGTHGDERNFQNHRSSYWESDNKI